MVIRKEKEHHQKKSHKSVKLTDRSINPINCNDENEQLQCFAPIIGCIRQGYPLPKSVSDGGVKMRCTNEKCEYARLLVHTQCFQFLENYLMKIISNVGSARGWTDIQRRHNLWEKKGLPLVQKLLRCKCERGQMIRDTDFYKQNKGDLNLSEKDELFTPYKLKKKKKKELPRLNFGYNSTVNENFELNKKKNINNEFYFLSSHEDEFDKSFNSIEASSCAPLCSTKINNNGRWRKVLLASPINEQKQIKTTLIDVTNNSIPSSWENNSAILLPSSITNNKTPIDLLPSSSSKFDKVLQNQNLSSQKKSINIINTLPLSNIIQSSLNLSNTTIPSVKNSMIKTSPSTIDYQNDKENIENVKNNSIKVLKEKNSSQNNIFFNSNNTNQLNNEKFSEENAIKYYTLFGKNTNFFLGERLLAEFFLPGTSNFNK